MRWGGVGWGGVGWWWVRVCGGFSLCLEYDRICMYASWVAYRAQFVHPTRRFLHCNRIAQKVSRNSSQADQPGNEYMETFVCVRACARVCACARHIPLATDSRISPKKFQIRDLGHCVKISSGEYGLANYYWGNEHPARHGLDEDARDSLAEHLFGEIRESGCSFPNNRSRVRDTPEEITPINF